MFFTNNIKNPCSKLHCQRDFDLILFSNKTTPFPGVQRPSGRQRCEESVWVFRYRPGHQQGLARTPDTKPRHCPANVREISQSRPDSGGCLGHISGTSLWNLSSCFLFDRQGKPKPETRHPNHTAHYKGMFCTIFCWTIHRPYSRQYRRDIGGYVPGGAK